MWDMIATIAFIVAPINLVIFVIQAIQKKPKKAWGISCIVSVVVFFIAVTNIECEHTWSEATCESPKTCSSCGEIEGAILPHQVASWTETKAATCTESGSRSGFCSVCDKEIIETTDFTDHAAGEWEVVSTPTANTAGEEAIFCQICGEKLDSRECTLSPEEIRNEYIWKCNYYSYEEIARNPNAFVGELAQFQGEVIQVMYHNGSECSLRVNITENKYGYWSDTIYVDYTVQSQNEPRILEGDIVALYGALNGMYTYESVIGATVTLPHILAEYVDVFY